MSKGKRGRKARLGQPRSGDYKNNDPWNQMRKVYAWTAPCKFCKRFGLHDPNCPAYVHKA
jgi:hypothetical protein